MRNIMMAVTAALVLSACGGGTTGTNTGTPSNPSPPAGGATANTLSGRVLDGAGKPVADAEVWIRPVSYEGLIKARTDAQGNYKSIELNPSLAPYEAQAYKMVNYYGEQSCVRMGGATSAEFDVFNAKDGAVRNFRWKMQGPAEGGYNNTTWGGELRFYRDSNTSDEDIVSLNEVLEVKLVPNGPLIDGSAGDAHEYTVLAGQRVIKDIPVGRYDLSAFVVNKDGTKTPLKLKADNDVQKTAWSNEITILFDGLSSCGHYATYHSTPIAIAH